MGTPFYVPFYFPTFWFLGVPLKPSPPLSLLPSSPQLLLQYLFLQAQALEPFP